MSTFSRKKTNGGGLRHLLFRSLTGQSSFVLRYFRVWHQRNRISCNLMHCHELVLVGDRNQVIPRKEDAIFWDLASLLIICGSRAQGFPEGRAAPALPLWTGAQGLRGQVAGPERPSVGAAPKNPHAVPPRFSTSAHAASPT